MKKLYSFNVLSDRTCRDCDKPLKKRLVEQKQNKPTRCYKCHIESEHLRGHLMLGKVGTIPGPTKKRMWMH
jgi:hypothetical protein